MDKQQLAKLLPKHRDDIDAAKELIRLGYPGVAPILNSLFQWLETSGSEVELLLRPFFAELGEPALELARSALSATNKPAKKASLLKYVLPAWPGDLITRLEHELMS